MIDRVHQLSLNEDQPLMADDFKFEWRINGAEIGEGDNNEDEGDIC